MPRDSFYRLPVERRERLLEAAAAELEARGAHDASLNRILERAGLSKGVAYHYFEDRDDLFATVLRDRLARLLEDVAFVPRELAAESFWEDLARTLARFVEPGRWDPRLLTVVRAVWALPAERRTRGAMGALWTELTSFLRAVIARGREVGTVRTDLPEDLLVSIGMAVGEACDRWFVDHWDASRATAMRQLGLSMLDLLRRVLEPSPAAGSRPGKAGSARRHQPDRRRR